MAAVDTGSHSAEQVKAALEEFISEAVLANGGSTEAVNPGHRTPFHWPPHPISYKYHVLTSDWTGRATFHAHGEQFEVKVARTPHGVFGRCEAIWNEAKGDTLDEKLDQLVRRKIPDVAGKPPRLAQSLVDGELSCK